MGLDVIPCSSIPGTITCAGGNCDCNRPTIRSMWRSMLVNSMSTQKTAIIFVSRCSMHKTSEVAETRYAVNEN
jgi:hypothetical protein